MQIADQTFLVTGGGSGLGAACVQALNKAGGQVVIADVNAATGEALAGELGARALRANRRDRPGERGGGDCRWR